MSEVSKKFKVGDKVVRTVECDAGYTIKQWGTYTISKIDEDLYVIYLEGIYDKEGKLDWFNPRNFELVKEDLHLGDKVKIISLQSKRNRGDCEVGVGAAGVIIDVDKCSVLKYLVEAGEGDPWWWEEENLELVKEEVTMSEQTQNTYDVTPKTPYQEKGFTENSLFKFIGDDGHFERGEVIKLHSDDGSSVPEFKSVTRDRCRYCFLDFDVEYIGEEGAEDMLPDCEETLTTQPTKDVVKQDNVNHPNHYKTGKTECIVAMEEMLSTEEFIGYLRGNIYKYTYRYKDKNGVEDLKKAQWYLNKLIEKEQQKETNHG